MTAELRDAVRRGLGEALPPRPDADAVDRCLRRVLPLTRKAGITRLGDLTRLDRLELPVVQAVRPEALSEVTSLGRGHTVAEAAVGAIMESLERHHAERIAAESTFHASADDLGIAGGLFDSLLAPGIGPDWRRAVIPWISGWNFSDDTPQPVPLELVHTRYTEPPPAGDGLFLRTTTGLACHTDGLRAFLHGLFECIERDAVARAFVTHGFFDRMRISPSNLGCDRLLARAADRGISVALWHAPSPAGIAVVWCQTIESSPAEPLLALPTEGYAAAATMEAAAAGAILEALAARPGAISGARDDQTRAHYRRSTDRLVVQARDLILQSAGKPPAPPAAIETLAALMERVAAGLGPILAVPIASDPAAGVACIRTLLPKARHFTEVR